MKRMNVRMLRKAKGVSLVEMILSIAVLSILCIYVIQMFIKSDDLNTKAKDLDQSIIISESVFEMIQEDRSLTSVFNSTLFKFAEISKNKSDVECRVLLDENWKPVNDENLTAYVLLLMADDLETKPYKSVKYTVTIERLLENSEMEIIYEIQMDDYY